MQLIERMFVAMTVVGLVGLIVTMTFMLTQ
jgi:hypothetical protein